MKVSVIIPVKNRAALLTITLNCILAQSAKPYEVIVVDDASTDDLASVIDTYKDRVTFLSSSGKGPGAARNTGMRVASGDAIQFFDSDDLMTGNKLEVQARLLEEENADFVYGPWVKGTYNGDTWKQTDVIMQYHPLADGNFADFVLKGWCNITQTVLFKRELLQKVGFWREDIMTHEDYEYWFRIGKHAKKFIHENESCVIYRQHGNQITDMELPNQSRWMDGIKAMQYIDEGIDYNASVESIWSFAGRMAMSKCGYIKSFGNDVHLKISLLDRLYSVYYKVNSKLTRVKGTSWQNYHGVLSPGDVEFNSYINSIKL